MSRGLGAVYTPEEWAVWLIKQGNIHQKWAQGATLLEPTAGEGAFLCALFMMAQEKGIALSPSLLKNLYIAEQEEKSVEILKKKIKSRFSIEIPDEQIYTGNIIDWKSPFRFDLIFGNLPWLNFTDLPQNEKENYKKRYKHYQLTDKGNKLLLGNSRVDLAALISAKLIEENLADFGELYLYLPLSLFFNEGAHNQFRRFMLGKNILPETIWDLTESNIFEGVGTRYGAAHILRNLEKKFHYTMTAQSEPNGPKISIPEDGSPFQRELTTHPIPRLILPKVSKARQGINCCGANALFHFTQITPSQNGRVWAVNGLGERILLPSELLYPLVNSTDFKQNGISLDKRNTSTSSVSAKSAPVLTDSSFPGSTKSSFRESAGERKYILLPYDKDTGKPLGFSQLEKKYPDCLIYLKSHKSTLAKRKGVFLGTWIKRGIWWALLGVGPYSFSPLKIVWEAYGKKTFNSQILSTAPLYPEGPEAFLQANQALQAFFPFFTREAAKDVFSQMEREPIEDYLKSFGTAGTCSWAQPGKINKICSFFEERHETN